MEKKVQALVLSGPQDRLRVIRGGIDAEYKRQFDEITAAIARLEAGVDGLFNVWYTLSGVVDEGLFVGTVASVRPGEPTIYY